MNKPFLSILCITYNHEKFIKQAIESWLMQKTNFNFEIIIADDASTDKNQKIIRKYYHDYQKVINPILRKKNIGPNFNWLDAFSHCKGKYIALCEGDDYWIDPLKLQKQVDFLENNPEYSLCFHDALILWDDKSQPPKYFCSKDQKDTSSIEDVIEKWFIPSASMVFRKEYITPLPDWFKDVYNGDYALHMLLAKKGKIKYFDLVMSVYRQSTNNLTSNFSKIKIIKKQIQLFNIINEYFDFEYNIQIRNRIKSLEKRKLYTFLRQQVPILKIFRPFKWLSLLKSK